MDKEMEYTEENLLSAKTYLFMLLLDKSANHKDLMTASDIDLGFTLSHDEKIIEMIEKIKKEGK